MVSFLCKLKWRLIQLVFKVVMPIVRSRLLSPGTQPDRLRQPKQPYLCASRVFIPKSLPKGPLPLLIDVHGGAFVVNTPIVDDTVCRYLADHAPCVVVSIDYRKAPDSAFPLGYQDIVAQMGELLQAAPASLGTDGRRAFLFGSSAGGNLVLAAAQDPLIRGRVAGVIGLYAVTDATVACEAKLASRPDATVPDLLETTYDEVLELYLGPSPVKEANAQDVRASPSLYKHRTDLPEHVYLIGAEHDLLCKEALDMAERLAGSAEKVQGGDDEWQAGTVKWRLARGQGHGYDIFGPSGETKDKKTVRLAAREDLYASMASWIRQTVTQLQ